MEKETEVRKEIGPQIIDGPVVPVLASGFSYSFVPRVRNLFAIYFEIDPYIFYPRPALFVPLTKSVQPRLI